MAQTLEFSVTGMTCDHCVKSVTNAVNDIAGVSGTTVSLEDKKAVVQGENLDAKAIIAAIEEEGYEASLA